MTLYFFFWGCLELQHDRENPLVKLTQTYTEKVSLQTLSELSIFGSTANSSQQGSFST